MFVNFEIIFTAFAIRAERGEGGGGGVVTAAFGQ